MTRTRSSSDGSGGQTKTRGYSHDLFMHWLHDLNTESQMSLIVLSSFFVLSPKLQRHPLPNEEPSMGLKRCTLNVIKKNIFKKGVIYSVASSCETDLLRFFFFDSAPRQKRCACVLCFAQSVDLHTQRAT